MKALTLTQPWASLVIRGVKRVETRSWRTSYEGPLAIHAAKSWSRDDREFAVDLIVRGILPNVTLPIGAVLGTVQLVQIGPTVIDGRALTAMAPARGRPVYYFAPIEYELGDYSPGRFAWLLADVEPFTEPIPARGALGLWEWSR